jgi:hypothetical protein
VSGRDQNHPAVPARGKKERDATCNVRTDLGAQRLEILLEQRSVQHGQDDSIRATMSRITAVKSARLSEKRA